MSLEPGTRLGPYEIVAPLGAGGMGEVYRARDTKLEREVAIKVLPASLAEDAGALARFEREARAVAALSHPNILSIFDFGTHDGTAYAVTELLEGETLRETLAAGPIPQRKCLAYGCEIAEGLAAAHEKGIVHRDLKPENVVVTREGHVKILDFGLAKTARRHGEEETSAPTERLATEPGTVMGTVGYMSPEQVRGQTVDHRTDIFSFGAMLYEMLSGRRAFRGATAADSLSAILLQDPPDLSITNPGIAPGLDRVVRHCLEKQPEQRFQSARDLAFDLEALSPVSSSAAGSARASGRPQARRALRVAVVALLAVAAAAVYATVRAVRAPHAVSYRQLTLRRQAIFAARATPDGRTIVFSAALQGNTPELFTVRADFPDPKPIGLRGAQLLAVSSKGELAVLTRARFIGHNLFHGTLARMPLEGGAPRDVLENVREADWSPDGGGLAVIREAGGKDRLEFPIGKVLCETGGYFSDVRFSPHGDRIAFVEHGAKWDDQGNVAVLDLSGRKTILTPVYWGVEGLAWTPGGGEVLFSRGTSFADFAVNAVSLSGRVRVAIETAGSLTIRDTSRDGRWLVTRDQIQAEMPVLGAGQSVERGLEWLDSSYFPALSTDGKTIVFTEQNGSVGPQYALCLRGTDGSPVVRLGDGSSFDLSPDGTSVLAVVPTSPQQLVLYPAGAGEARQLDRGGIDVFDSAKFFPDGRAALVCGHEAGGTTRCYVQHFAGDTPRQVTPDGMTNGIVSPDARSILVSAIGGGFVVYPVAGGEGRSVPGTGPEDKAIRWSRNGRSVLAYRSGEIPLRVERVDVESGRRELVWTLAPADLGGVIQLAHVAVAADEKSYAYVCERAISHLFLVEGAR
ncbi:MAG: protein kinase [Acidobacteriota bacterium]